MFKTLWSEFQDDIGDSGWSVFRVRVISAPTWTQGFCFLACQRTSETGFSWVSISHFPSLDAVFYRWYCLTSLYLCCFPFLLYNIVLFSSMSSAMLSYSSLSHHCSSLSVVFILTSSTPPSFLSSFWSLHLNHSLPYMLLLFLSQLPSSHPLETEIPINSIAT